LFKLWTKKTSESLMTNGNISEENVIKIVKHFFPLIEIIEDKYVLNVCSSLWNKEVDMNNSFVYIKEEIKKNQELEMISFDELYKYYNKYCNTNSIKLIVSKRYFEKYLRMHFSSHIVYDTFLETKILV